MENSSNSLERAGDSSSMTSALDLQDPTHLLPLSTTEVYIPYSAVLLAGDHFYSCTITSKVTLITSCFSLSRHALICK